MTTKKWSATSTSKTFNRVSRANRTSWNFSMIKTSQAIQTGAFNWPLASRNAALKRILIYFWINTSMKFSCRQLIITSASLYRKSGFSGSMRKNRIYWTGEKAYIKAVPKSVLEPLRANNCGNKWCISSSPCIIHRVKTHIWTSLHSTRSFFPGQWPPRSPNVLRQAFKNITRKKITVLS